MPYSFYFDADKCIKCKSCEAACKQWKGIRAGTVRLRRVGEVVSGVFPELKRQFYSVSCRHCAKAPCVEACPTGAITKRPDGIVFVNHSECIGCQACLEKCPFGVPQFDDDGLMRLCDMCLDRIEKGQIPVCVAACPTRALRWGTLTEISKIAGKKADKYLIR
jgi:anaerobic dimethyl sulfoxide reductase subunit B (iron-sulfur subunit)